MNVIFRKIRKIKMWYLKNVILKKNINKENYSNIKKYEYLRK